MRIELLCKRFYTNKDLIKERFGRLFHLPVQLAKLGHDVKVTALDYRSAQATEYEIDGVTFSALPATVAQLPFLPYRTHRAISPAKADFVIASGDSHIGFMAWQISRRHSSRFVFDVYDYYPAFKGNRIPGMKTMFKIAVSQADLVLCASRPLQSRLDKWNHNTLLIENGVDTTLFRPMDKQAARQSLGIDADIAVIGFFGAITPQRGPLLLEACKILRQRIPNLKLLLAGNTQSVDIIFPWVDYRGELAQRDIPQHIAACDVVTLPYANDEFNRMAGACKIAEYLACCKPIVATHVAGHTDYLKTAPEGLCEPAPGAMAAAIERQLRQQKIAAFPNDLLWNEIATKLSHQFDLISPKVRAAKSGSGTHIV